MNSWSYQICTTGFEKYVSSLIYMKIKILYKKGFLLMYYSMSRCTFNVYISFCVCKEVILTVDIRCFQMCKELTNDWATLDKIFKTRSCIFSFLHKIPYVQSLRSTAELDKNSDRYKTKSHSEHRMLVC